MRQGSVDDFQTPENALDILIPYLKKEWKIWECASGNGNLIKGFNDRGYIYIISSDILMEEKEDFLKWQPDEFDCIVTNPPYSLK